MTGDRARPTRVVEDPVEIDNPILAFFLAYWRDKREGGMLPRYANFALKENKAHLSWVVVVEALPAYTDFRYRVVGTRVTQYFLSDGTGKTVRQAFADMESNFVEGIVWLNRQACIERSPIRLTGPATVLNEIYFPDYDTIYLPYSSDGTTADKVVNVFTFNHQKIHDRHTVPASPTQPL